MNKYLIARFTGPYRFLGNFYPATTWFEGRLYDYSETAYQAAKIADRDLRRRLFDIHLKPGRAKLLGGNIYYREDWEDIRRTVMSEVVRDKFMRHPPLRRRLLATHPAILIEGNGHGDALWGITRGPDGNWAGENWLGLILMGLRMEWHHVDT